LAHKNGVNVEIHIPAPWKNHGFGIGEDLWDHEWAMIPSGKLT
jgi:hypothetical protein